MNKIIEGLNFQPWIPEKYGDADNPYGKLLIVGESHYGAYDGKSTQIDPHSPL